MQVSRLHKRIYYTIVLKLLHENRKNGIFRNLHVVWIESKMAYALAPSFDLLPPDIFRLRTPVRIKYSAKLLWQGTSG